MNIERLTKAAGTPENRIKIQQVAEKLLGSSDSLDDAPQEVFGEGVELTDVDLELLEILDDTTMQCDSCGWWCEASEFVDTDSNESSECVDCRERG